MLHAWSATWLCLLVGVVLAFVWPAAVSAQSTGASYVYDSLGRLVTVYDASGNAAVYRYDAVGNLLSVTNYSSTQFAALELSSSSGIPGANVTIYGTGFCSNPTVTFNGVAAAVSSATSTQIVVTVPAAATTGSLLVTCGSNQINGGTFTVASKGPTISGFSPTIGSPGTSVTITGTNFQTNPSANKAVFNITYTAIASSTSTSITTTVPSNTTSGPITAMTPYGQTVSSSMFYVPPPGTTLDYTGQLTLGTPVTASGNTANQQMLLVFNGTAGHSVSVTLSNSTFSGCPNVSIYNPNGSNLVSQGYCGSSGFIDAQPLLKTGAYSIVINPGSSTGSVNVTAYDAALYSGNISIGGPPVTVTASVPGQDTKLSFSGSAGQQISLGITNNTMPGCPNPYIYIYNPDGSQLTYTYLCGSSYAFIDSTTLAQTGTYTIYVDVGNSTGGMTLTLYNLNDISSSVNVSDSYAMAVLGDTPQMYWRLDEPGPLTAANAVPSIKYGTAGPTSPDNAITLSGGASYVATSKQFSNPSTYSVEIWFKTRTTTGGKLIGFGGSQVGSSSGYDRHIYMTNSGQLVFGQYTSSIVTVTSSSSYNDGVWHQAVGTYNGSTMVLYVDGAQVGSTSAGAPYNYAGYWRLGYDNLYGWPSAPANYHFLGSLGQAAVYSSALTAAQVSNHYAAAAGGSYDSTMLADGPTSYWKLNESSGPTFADSTAGNNSATAVSGAINGVYQGGLTYSQPGAISTDYAVSFDGSTGVVQSLQPPPIGNTGASLEAWIYIPSSWTPASGSYGAIFQAGTYNGIGFGIVYNYQGTTGFSLFGLYEYVRWITVSGAPALSTNTWYHLVMTVNGSGIPAFYINGTSYSQASSGGSPVAPTGAIYVADDPAASGRYFGGTIDEPAVYNYALSTGQVLTHYLSR